MASTLKIDTVTTPDGTGNITFNRPIVADGSNLTNLPASGKILQVVSANKSDTASTTSTSFTDIAGMTVTTGALASTSSKVLVMVKMTMGGSSNAAFPKTRLLRGSTVIAVGDAAGSRNQVSDQGQLMSNDTNLTQVITYLDSPNSTSAQTYHIEWHQWHSSYTCYINRSGSDSDNSNEGRAMSTITAMEVGA